MTNELTLENIRSGAFPSDAHAVGFLLGEIARLQRENAEARELIANAIGSAPETKTDSDIFDWSKPTGGYMSQFVATNSDGTTIESTTIGSVLEFRESRGENPAQGPVPAASGETPTARLSDEPSSAHSSAGQPTEDWLHWRTDAAGTWVRYDDIKHLLQSKSATEPASPQARPLSEYHEDMGPVLWWRFPVDEPPYAGTPTDDGWIYDERDDPPNYYTHWTPIPLPPRPWPSEKSGASPS